MDESDIERIETDYRGSDEQSYQMFLKWKQRGGQVTYYKLGEALQETRNRNLYPEFVQKINDNI